MKIICYLLAIAFSCSLVGCGKIELPSIERFSIPEIKNVGFEATGNNLSEVAPPNTILQLDRTFQEYQPQVSIVRPQPNETLQEDTVEIVLAVENYPLFKDESLGMGPHLNLIVDNEHYREIYDLEQPIIIKDLKPGSHSLRVLVEKPWHESFKNPEAIAHSTFNILTETTNNTPDFSLPLLTYNQPSGVYSAEPILLDFYLTGIDTKDWQVKATINEESFIIDEWQPIYLQGFQEGNNLVKLELLDGEGKAIENQFNQPIRLVDYDIASSEKKELAQLVTDKIPFEEAIAITQQNYYIQPVEEPEIVDTTEELSEEVPIEKVEIEEPTTEEVPIEKVEIEEPTTEEVPIETSANVTEEVNAIANNLEEAIEIAEKEKDIVLFSEAEENQLNQEPETTDITIEDTAYQDDISTTSTVEEPNVTDDLIIEDSPKIKEDIAKIPVPENIDAVETEDSLIASNTEESDTIKIEIPKPKLKVPQWWKDFVTYLQSRFNNI